MKSLRLHGTTLVTGPGSLEYLKNVSFQKAMIITGGKSMFATGVIDRAKAYLQECGGTVEVYAGIGKNPTTGDVMKGLEAAKVFQPDLFVAIGGGSPIDCAKIIALFYEYPKLNFDNVRKVKLPDKREKTAFIAVPSTSGTASEVTNVSVITWEEENLKIGIKSMSLLPDVAILDGELPKTLPANIVAETGMDAFTHALECFINKNVDDFTATLAKSAIEGICKWLPVSYLQGSLESRQKMHNYQCMAGMAFSNTGLGMVHGISHAFGGRYNLAHGLTNAVILPYSMQYNQKDPQVAVKFEELSHMLGKPVINLVFAMNKDLSIPSSIQKAGVAEEDFLRNYDLLVQNGLKGATVANPIPISVEDMQKIIKNVYYGVNIDY